MCWSLLDCKEPSDFRAKDSIPGRYVAWDKASDKAGLAWIFRNWVTSMDHHGSHAQDHLSSALMAEALVVRSSLQSAALRDISKINSENQTLIRVINIET
ncbi:hypothetical protein DY000_02040979 [Brassica cretica]|uniref:RNase H type-1 domain-containing protein n=1 Tax=Brassica cretica TaxID=69181 RepID=A0ABQ7BEG7_BRACR|nr:hypothetical protein DY000_02040979 [Brassica cretica]